MAAQPGLQHALGVWSGRIALGMWTGPREWIIGGTPVNSPFSNPNHAVHHKPVVLRLAEFDLRNVPLLDHGVRSPKLSIRCLRDRADEDVELAESLQHHFRQDAAEQNMEGDEDSLGLFPGRTTILHQWMSDSHPLCGAAPWSRLPVVHREERPLQHP